MSVGNITDQLIISLGALTVVWAFLGRNNGFAPAVAGGVCGWLYPEVTALCLSAFLTVTMLKRQSAETAASAD